MAYSNMGMLAKALGSIYNGHADYRAKPAGGGLDGLSAGVGGGIGAVMRGQQSAARKAQLQKAKQALEDKKMKAQHDYYVKTELSPAQQETYALNSGMGTKELGLGQKSYGDLYGQAMSQQATQAMGQELNAHLDAHDAADTTPIAGVNTPRGEAEQRQYAAVNGADMYTGHNMMRHGIGMSSVGINPDEELGR